MPTDKLMRDLEQMIASKNPRQSAAVDGSAYTKKAPEILVELWSRVGAASWKDGSYQTIDPALYKSAVEFALSGSPIDSSDAVPYILYAFGKLTVWHETWGLINIDPVLGRNTVLEDPKKRVDNVLPDIEILSGFPILDADEINFGLFKSATKRLGALEIDEIFAFFPALSLGGNKSLKSVQKMFAPVHLDFLCQSVPFETFFIGGSIRRPELIPLK